jgi:hypothetical protein
MKFLIDAQLPRRLAHQLEAAGFETTHTLIYRKAIVPPINLSSPLAQGTMRHRYKRTLILLSRFC